MAKRQKRVLKKNIKKPANPGKVLSKKAKDAPPKKPIAPEKTEIFTAESLFKAKIKVIGIGGGGGSIVSEIGRSLEKATFLVADTDARALNKKKPGIKYFIFGEEMAHGLGTGMNVDLARRSAEMAKEKISEIFKDQDIIIFIASLGGGLGSGATEVFAKAAREFGGITLGIFTMPFRFEGAAKYRIAQNALKTLRQSLSVSLVIPNEKIFKIIDSSTAITDAFSMVNRSLVKSLESLIDLIYSPGVINIDFADLRTILSGIGNMAFLNTVEESGKDRAEKICKKILVNPLLQNGSFEAERILLNIAGSGGLSMFEVEKISRLVAELNPKAKIIFGISKIQKLGNKIKATVLMTGGGTMESKKAENLKPAEKPEAKIAAVKKKPKKIAPPLHRQKPKKPRKQKTKNPSANKKQKIHQQKPEKIIPSFIPIFQPRQETAGEKKLSIVQQPESIKTAIRRSGLEIKKAEEMEAKKREAQEKEWEIPAFLRKVKYNK